MNDDKFTLENKSKNHEKLTIAFGKLDKFEKPLYPYTDDYVRILLKKEKAYLEAPRNFRTNSRARNIVVNWLLHVHHRYRLTQTALHKTVALMDFYSSRKHVGRNRLQLIALSCTSLVVKKIGSPPEPSEFVKLCGSHFVADDLYQGEVDVLKIAKFDLDHPVGSEFLTIFLEYFNLPPDLTLFAQYFLDLWLFHLGIARHRGSVVASVALVFAMRAAEIDVDGWQNKLAGFAHFSRKEFNAMVTAMSKTICLFDYEKYPAILVKYPAASHQRVQSMSQHLDEFDNFLGSGNSK